MKFSGTIIGFQSSYGSIYNIITDDTKCYAWKANAIAEINGNMIVISFNWNGDLYEIRLSKLKDHYYTGRILFNRELDGEAFFWRFDKNESLLLKGDFIEDGVGYECFIELNLLKTV